MTKKTTSSKSQANLLKFGRERLNQNANHENQEKVEQKYIVTKSTSIGNTLLMMLMVLCRRITSLELVKNRIIIYAVVIFFGGLFNDFSPIFQSTLKDLKIHKGHVLNQWFVKIGWAWTLALLTPFIALTNEILSLTKKDEIIVTARRSIHEQNNKVPLTKKLKALLSKLQRKALFRLVINTTIWYYSVYLFTIFENWTSGCSEESHKLLDRNSCVSYGYKWAPGFDISGHTFLLLFSNFIILEECAVMIGWEIFGDHLYAERQDLVKKQEETEHQQHLLYLKYQTPLRLLFVALTALSVIWDFMLMQTSFYYHTMFQKFVAFLWALSCWYVTYRYLYQNLSLSVKSAKTYKLN